MKKCVIKTLMNALIVLSILLLVDAAVSPRLQAGPYSTSSIGYTFNNLREVADYYENQGYIMLGRFEYSEWPAVVVYEKEAMNEISFILKNRGTHTYPGYDGYRLKVIALEDSFGYETMVVFRSKEKETP